MIIVLSIAAFTLFVGALLKVLLPHFFSYLRNETCNYIRYIFTEKKFDDLGEFFATVISVSIITFISFIFYKGLIALTAYLISDNLISFFTILRGVFTIRNDFQSPLSHPYFWTGYFLYPAIQFITCFILYRGIRNFMLYSNRKLSHEIYNEKDVLFFGFFGVSLFIWMEITSFSQDISFISGFAHFAFLLLSMLSIVLYYLSISHIHLLKNEEYKNSLPQYFELSETEKYIIFSPWKVAALTYLLGCVLHAPFNTGTQFLYSNFLIGFSLLICAFVFYLIVVKYGFTKSYNNLGTVMMAESYNRRLILLLNFEIVDQKKLIWISGSVTFLFLTLELKLFFFALFFVLTALLIYLFAYISSYGSGLGFSLLRTKLYDNALPKMSWLAISKYLTRVSTVTGMAVAPIIWFVFFVFVLFSFFPKKYDIKHQEDDTHVNAVFDSNGNPLFIEHTNGNGSIPLEYEEMPEFLLKMLYLQEDRFFLKQNRWFINRSNWHGFSLATFYRYFSSGGGGSNLNMQLIKNEAFPTASFPQDIQRKFAETVTSYHLSLQMRPEEIVTQYLNKISMNGGIGHSGLMAASLYTFNLPVWDLNPLEMLYMVNTLKSGSSFRTINGIYIPYRSTESHQEEIKNTLIEKAEVWLNNGHITKPEYNMLRNSDLRFKNHSPKIETNSSTRDFLIKEIKRINSSAFKYRSSLSLENQKKVAVAVQTFESKFSHDLRNGDYQLYSATLVVNIETGEVIGHYGGHGTSDLTRFSAGFPMSSLIKPFVLLELLEQGFPSNLQLYDGPIDGKFTPQNHNHQYLYRHVGIREILTDSKNAPMVNIREITNPLPLYRNVENRFNNMGISEDPFLNFNNTLMQQELILNYPLGSRNMTLYDIAQAYQVLLNNGEYIKLSVLRKNTQKQSRVINKKRIYTRNALYIKSALQGPFMLGGTAHHLINQLPDGRVYYAKTGTSDGAKHGYTVLSDGNLMVVSYVTYGKNEDGHLELNDTPPIPHQSGGVVRENLLL